MKYTTLEHMQADQVAKLPSDIIYRRLVQVRPQAAAASWFLNVLVHGVQGCATATTTC